jgi:hypothetical protein
MDNFLFVRCSVGLIAHHSSGLMSEFYCKLVSCRVMHVSLRASRTGWILIRIRLDSSSSVWVTSLVHELLQTIVTIIEHKRQKILEFDWFYCGVGRETVT